MFDAEAIREIKDGVQSEIKEIDGSKFHMTNSGINALKYPSEDSIRVFSLSQLVSFLHVYPKLSDELLVNVVDYDTVSVVKKNKDRNLNTVLVATTCFEKVFEKFESNSRFSQEDFIVRLQSRFVRTSEVEALIALTSQISGGKTSETTDNGYAQIASTKAGVHLTSEATVKPIWKLNPFKTFPEIDPVEVPFILRLHQRGEELPQFALYEADGGRWKIETTKAIREWLKNQLIELQNVTVL